MTNKLYDTNPYQTNFEANVLSCLQEKNRYDVVLDQTLFFPEEGGQSCDKGFINDIEVIDVQIKNGILHHYLKRPLQGHVHGSIHWEHRFSNMQNHSGEHILSGFIHSMYGFDNVGFHLGNDEVTADYDGILTNAQIEDLEKKVNECIQRNVPIHCGYPNDPSKLEYRSKIEIKEAIRIVEIEGVDICACCAPHVKSTIEVGVFKVLKFAKHKKGTRIYFLCGKRAIDLYQIIYQQAMKISNLFSSPIEDIYTSAKRVNDETVSLKQKIASVKKQRIDDLTQNLSIQDSYLIFEEDMDANTQKYYLNKLKPFAQDFAAIFVKQETNYRFLLVSNQDARNQLQLLKDHFQVRGGGKQDNIQGTIEASEEEIRRILKKV